MISPNERQYSIIAPEPLSCHSSRTLIYQEEKEASLQTTPESKSGYSSPDDYHGGSDISVQKSASSATDRELFSGSEDDTDSEDDEPSGFEPTEVADILPAASGALGTEDQPCDFTSDGLIHDVPSSDFGDEDSDGDYDPEDGPQTTRKRTFSYESYPIAATSPTESQLVEEGFEFHNQLSEDNLLGRFNSEEKLLGQFNHEAFQDAIKELTPDLPRKQQWYTWRKVMEMLEEPDAAHVAVRHHSETEDLFDDSNIANDFSLGSLADVSFGGCQCAGDSKKCTCVHGQCGCASCPHREQTQAEQNTLEGDNDAEQDIPMVIGHTPITPSFPPVLHHPQPSRAISIQPSSHAGIRIPGLEPFEEDEAVRAQKASHQPSKEAPNISSTVCNCQCGQSCQCPAGRCRCAPIMSDKNQMDHVNITHSRHSYHSIGRGSADPDPRDIWSDAATAGMSSPATDPREPEAQGNTFPQIARTLTSSTILSPTDAPTPAPGFRSPLPSPKREAKSISIGISRPDTPRPQGDTYEHGIRQSVEPEHAPPVSYRESTPAYENRSLSPSPISYTDASDVEMHDITPTRNESVHTRETSVLPDAPGQEPLSPPGSPDINVAPSRALDNERQVWAIPPPPVPMSPTLKPRKQRATSGSASPGKRNTKSGVQGSKIAKPQPKARNMTRKVTTKGTKGKRDVTGARVKQAVDAIEETIKRDAEEAQRGLSREYEVLQRDGTPPRRSARVRARSQSPFL
jgi:hypothetical protein